MYSAVTTSQRYFPLRASLLIRSMSPAPPRRRYLTLMGGYFASKAPIMRPTIEPPVRVPYHITSPSFFAFSRTYEFCCASAKIGRERATTNSVAVTKHFAVCKNDLIVGDIAMIAALIAYERGLC